MKQKLITVALLGAITFPFLTHAETPMELVIVTPTRMPQALDKTIADTTVLDEQDIRDSGAVDVPSLLKNLAGVEFYQSGGIGKQSSLFLRGTNSSHVLVLLDGVRINSATTGATAIDQLMLDQVERIEVVRGNVSSLYGSEAIGGVIQIFTKHGKGEPAFNASGGAGSNNTQRLAAGFGGETGDTTFNVKVSRFKTEGVSAIKPEMVQNIQPDKDGYDNTSLSANVRHAFNTGHSLSASAYSSQGDSQYDTLRYDPATFALISLPTDANNSKEQVSKFSLTFDDQATDSWQSRLQLAQGKDDGKDYINGTQNSAIRTTNRQIGWQNTIAVNSFGSVLLGLENLNQQVSSTTAYTQAVRKVNSLFGGYTGSYSEHQVQANIRQDRYSDFGMANTSLLGYGYEISDVLRATATISTAFKAPAFNDLYGPSGWGSNPNLRPERSRNMEVGLHYAADGQRFDAVYFDNRIRDLIAADNTWTLQNLRTARSGGIEISYAGQFGDTGVRAAITSQNPRDTDTGQMLLRRAKAFANLGVLQQFDHWKVGGEWQYSGKREDYDINTFARTTLASYSLVNLTANYDINKQFRLSLRADNLLNKDYMLAHGYNSLGRTLFAGLNYQQ